jgi:hydroxymethylpyrimidine pyrophosphatase-like HAD family hydrolase
VFVAALTYLSVTISIRNNLPVVPFAINRIASTIIGVLVALLVNNFKLFRFKNKKILFVSGLDGCLLTEDKKLSPFTHYSLNNLLNDGLNFTVSTTRTPASLSKIFNNVPLRNNLMIMNGAASYDKHNELYMNLKFIDKTSQIRIDEYFSSIDRNIFTYTIIDEVLSIYHTSFENEAEAKFYSDRKNNYFKNHIKGKLNESDNVLFYILIDKFETVNKYKDDLLKAYGDFIHIQIYEYSFFTGYYFMKIYTSKASKLLALEEFLNENKSEVVISFGSKEYDLEIMERSDYSFALNTACEEVKNKASKVLDSNNPDDVIRLIRKVYYKRNFKKYLNKLIKEK